MSDSKTRLVATAVAQLDHDICATCSSRIFRECGGLPGAPGVEDGERRQGP